MHPGIVETVIDGIERVGGSVCRDPATDLLTINRELTASVVIVRCFHTSAGSLRWKVRLDNRLKPNITVAVRMDSATESALDYYLLPRLDMRDAVLRLAEFNGLSFDAYRFETLDPFYRMTARAQFRKAA